MQIALLFTIAADRTIHVSDLNFFTPFVFKRDVSSYVTFAF